MAHYNANSLCVHCKHLRPALDLNIQKAYLGKCMKREWPFTLAITLQGWTRMRYVRGERPEVRAARPDGA